MALDITPVWKQVTPELKAELVEFWKENNALGKPEQAEFRADQAACISRDKKGKLVGVATAVIKVLPRLRQPMYYYRHFFAESLRGQHATQPFVKSVKQVLQQYNASLDKPESLGILVELESKLLASRYTKAYEPDSDFTFIGYSPRGFQMRVSYFEGVELLPPAPLRRRAGAGGGAGARSH